MKKALARLSYANVTATLALFIALGGTSYAVATLPRNSVGPAQLRSNAVGSSELRKQAVRSSDVGDRTIRLRDISIRARHSLKGETGPPGPQGPPGPTFTATVNSGGDIVKGNATAAASSGAGRRVVGFARSVATCVPSPTLTTIPGGATPTPPTGAAIRAQTTADGRVLVEMFDQGGGAAFYPFNLIVAC
jgi:hypothetical protein